MEFLLWKSAQNLAFMWKILFSYLLQKSEKDTMSKATIKLRDRRDKLFEEVNKENHVHADLKSYPYYLLFR